MVATKYEICSRALNEIGYGSINDFTSKEGAICGDMWDFHTRFLQSIYPWFFARKKIQLGRNVTPPINEYQYSYQLAGDLLTLHAAYSSGSAGAIPIQGYDLFGQQLFTNESTVYIDYQAYVISENCPSWYDYFVSKSVALQLAKQFPTDPEKVNRLETEVWGPPQDNRRGGLFGFCMNLDSKQRPAEPITDFSLLAVRYI